MTDRLTTGAILSATANLIAGDLAVAAAALGGLIALGVATDLGGLHSDVPTSIVGLILAFSVTRRLVKRIGLAAPEGTRGFGGFFGMSLLTGLGILAGLVLLIVPGIYLAARWSIAQPLQVAGGRSVTEAIGESWRTTAPHVLAIVLAVLTIWAPSVIGLVMVGVIAPLGDSLGDVIAINTLAFAPAVTLLVPFRRHRRVDRGAGPYTGRGILLTPTPA